MRAKNVLTVLYYDPEGHLYQPLVRALPVLTAVFEQICLNASQISSQKTLDLFIEAGASVARRPEKPHHGMAPIGFYRRSALSHALDQNAGRIVYCDSDRAAYWANNHPNELIHTVRTLADHDFVVIGRTPAAFQSHPEAMIRTEAIVNHLFAQVSGNKWDVLAAARGMSAAAAQYIIDHSKDDTFGVDPSWPLLIQQHGGFSMGYIEVDGMAFETADSYPAEVAAAGSLEAWKAQRDLDLDRWLFRLEAAKVEIEAIRPYI